MKATYAPEIVIGFVAPSGSRFDEVREAVTDRLSHYNYRTIPVRLSDFLLERSGLMGLSSRAIDHRTPALQREGDAIRREWARPDALAIIASGLIRKGRAEANGTDAAGNDGVEPLQGTAYLVWSLKHPAEVTTLRAIYAGRFFLFSAYAPREQRERRLSEAIAESNGHVGESRRYTVEARKIIDRDEAEPDPTGEGFVQNVRSTYPLADFFVDASSDGRLHQSVNRAIDIIFGDPFATPTRDEFGMFIAQAAALRSAEMGRQVGAAITTTEGDVVATGTNEVPAPGGGHYWTDDLFDHREYRRRADTSDVMKWSLAGQILSAFGDRGWLSSDAGELDVREVYRALRDTRIRDLTEFGRAVHAESSAMLDAAKRGVPIAGRTMYVTTFPCHQCTRHVVAAGIRRLVFIYPYPKSLADELHGDAIQSENLGNLDSRRVPFEPFLGVAPRQYLSAFTAGRRKDEQGRSVPINDKTRVPQLTEGDTGGFWDQADYVTRESVAQAIAAECIERIEEKGSGDGEGHPQSVEAPGPASFSGDEELA